MSTDHAHRHPQPGDIFRWNKNVSRNAQGTEFTITDVEESFGTSYRVGILGRLRRISGDDLNWTADFVREGPPPRMAPPTLEARRDAAYLNAKASSWMEGVKAGWRRADEFEESRAQHVRAHQLRKETKELERQTTDDLIAAGRKVLSDNIAADRVVLLRKKVEAFWAKHSPHKLPQLDDTMASFKGREDRLAEELAEELAAAEAKMAELSIIIRSAAGPIVPPLHRGALNAAQKEGLLAHQDEADMPA